MPPNPNTAAAVGAAAMGAGIVGAQRMGWVNPEEVQRQLQDLRTKRDDAKAVAMGLFRTSACATAAGWFQVYSGGIIIDTVATRLQAGATVNQALWGLRTDRPVAETVARFTRRSASRYASLSTPTHQVYSGMLLRSNLTAGHFVTMLSRFPYLFLNFTTYQQTEKYLLARSPGAAAARPKTAKEEFICVSASTVISTTAITVAECPKILDQVGGIKCGAARSTVGSIWREHGLRRLFRGYSACFLREYFFNVALLGSPALAAHIHERVEPGSLIEGKEIVVASVAMGLPMGVLTNVPDQLKTRIQM